MRPAAASESNSEASNFMRSNRYSATETPHIAVRLPEVFVAFLPAREWLLREMKAQARPAKAAFVVANPKRKLFDQVQEVLRVKHYFLRTGETGVQEIRRHLIYCLDHSGLA